MNQQQQQQQQVNTQPARPERNLFSKPQGHLLDLPQTPRTT